jgi:thiamine kinase-like enzyme
MSPSKYINARKNPEEARVTIDGEIYLPFVSADSTKPDSVKHVVAEMFLLEKYRELQIKPVTGGITNKLFRVSGISGKDDSLPDSVLVRIFGGEGMIDRDSETATYASLASQGIALGYHGRFENGRLEEFCDHMTSLKVEEMGIPEISLGIAKSLASMHVQYKVPEDLKKYHDPSKPPTLWTQLTSWLDQALNSKFKNDFDTKRAQYLELPKLKQELDWLQSSVISEVCKVGFCHNDLLAANIMWCSSTKAIQLIDFEYGGINYLSYDIANHFNEFAGGTDGDATPDYTKFPSPELQKDFVKEYLTSTGKAPSTEEINALLKEIKGFVLANHLVWGLWGINQAATEGCREFDYLKYGTYRINQYYVVKKEFENE